MVAQWVNDREVLFQPRFQSTGDSSAMIEVPPLLIAELRVTVPSKNPSAKPTLEL